MRFQYSLDFENFTEKIRYWYATDIYEIENVFDADQHYVTGPLFYTVSDLLSVNYSNLIDKLINYLLSYNDGVYKEYNIYNNYYIFQNNFIISLSFPPPTRLFRFPRTARL